MPINREHMKAWVEDLRTTQEPQASGRLRREIDEDGHVGYCCLGRACVVAIQHGVTDVTEDPSYGWLLGGANDFYLPQAVAEWLGITVDQTGHYVDLNDGQRLSFSQIADEIEKEFDL